MIIHSIVSLDDIFHSQSQPPFKTHFVPLRHGFLELDEKRMIRRVVSTNPQDYLNKNYQLEKYLP